MGDNVYVSVVTIAHNLAHFLGYEISLPFDQCLGERSGLIFKIKEIGVDARVPFFILVNLVDILEQAVCDGLELIHAAFVTHDEEEH